MPCVGVLANDQLKQLAIAAMVIVDPEMAESGLSARYLLYCERSARGNLLTEFFLVESHLNKAFL
jgi:N-acetylglutamate synthase-like GNAT family acetyltransferase